MKEIKLTQGQVTQVDDDDFVRFGTYKWHAVKGKGKRLFYATSLSFGMLHRAIMGVTDRMLVVDHRDGNSLNNQKANLRICTVKQNNQNARKHTGKSKYKGVTVAHSNKWRAQIRHEGRCLILGYFTNEVDAAIAYNTAAKEIHKEFAYLNQIPQNH